MLVVLAEEIEQFRPEPDAGVEPGVRTGNVGAELDQVFGIPIHCQRLPQIARRRLLGGSGQRRCQPAKNKLHRKSAKPCT